MTNQKVFSLRNTIGLLALILLSSCVPQSKIKYLQGPETDESEEAISLNKSTKPADYRVTVGDYLYITISSMDEKIDKALGASASQGNSYNTDVNVYLQSFKIDHSGTIFFPIIGNIKVSDLTIDEIREQIQKSLVDFFRAEAIVNVKLVNFNVTILGEVNRPGKYTIYKDQVTIFEAIGMAGDLTNFAARKKVKLLRQSETGYKILTLDLTKQDIVSSDVYQIMPNDVIIIDPLKLKQFGFATFPYQILFSTISTTVLIVTLILNSKK